MSNSDDTVAVRMFEERIIICGYDIFHTINTGECFMGLDPFRFLAITLFQQIDQALSPLNLNITIGGFL